MTSLLVLLAAFFIRSVTCNWDIAVATGDKLELLNEAGRVVGSTAHEMGLMSALAYDVIHGHLYFSDTSHPNTSIFRVKVLSDGSSQAIEPLVAKSGKYVQGIAFDVISMKVYWTTGMEKKIMRADVGASDDLTQTGEVVHTFQNEIPQGIAIDSCRRYMYWTNSYMQNATIERSRLDGTQREVIVWKDLFLPSGLTVSLAEGMLYWAQEKAGSHYTIERSYLDGSQREVVVFSQHQQPFSLAVADGRIFWTDWSYQSIWSAAVDPLLFPISSPSLVKNYTKHPNGIVVKGQRASLNHPDCQNVVDLRNKVVSSNSIVGWNGLCINGKKVSGKCQCHPGFTGASCEMSLCHNYCLNGECSLGRDGNPTCLCNSSWSGPRCSVNLCVGHCLNEGACSIKDGLPSCECSEGFLGDRCQIPKAVCDTYCSSGEKSQYPSCNCHLWVSQPVSMFPSTDYLAFWKISCYSLIMACALLLLVIIFISLKAWSMRKRPRFKRRFKINPPKASDTCEIAIENCCNMNICETPCYEPEFKTPHDLGKKDEKKGLLGNIEIQPSPCSQQDLF